jgi:hypothetical protein
MRAIILVLPSLLAACTEPAATQFALECGGRTSVAGDPYDPASQVTWVFLADAPSDRLTLWKDGKEQPWCLEQCKVKVHRDKISATTAGAWRADDKGTIRNEHLNLTIDRRKGALRVERNWKDSGGPPSAAKAASRSGSAVVEGECRPVPMPRKA